MSAVMVAGLSACGSTQESSGGGSATSSSDAAESESGQTSGDSSDDTGTAEGEVTKITFALDWTPNTNHTGLYVADALGYFAEYGIEVEFVQTSSGYGSELVGAGQAEFGIDFQDSLAYTFSSDDPIPVTAVAAVIQHNTCGILTRADSNVSSPKDLAGLHYATWEDPMEQAVMKYCIEADGGSFDDVICDPVYVEDAVAGLNSGIDAIWIYYGWDGIRCELSEDVDTNFFYFTDYCSALDEYSPVIIANNDFMEANPDVASDFISAVAQGYNYAIANPDEAAQILCDAVPELDYDLVLNSQRWISEKYRDDAEYWGMIDSDRWNAVFTWMYENGVLENPVPTDYGFSMELLSKSPEN